MATGHPGDIGDEEDDLAVLEAALKMNEELKALEKAMDNRASFVTVNAHYQPGASRVGRNPLVAKRTFTKAPATMNTLKSTRPKADYTHSTSRLGDIEKGNQRLAEKLQKIHLDPRDGHATIAAGPVAPISRQKKVASVAPSSINRLKKQSNIDKENARMLARLQKVKPDKTVSVRTHTKEFAQHQKYSMNCSKTLGRRPKPPPEWQD